MITDDDAKEISELKLYVPKKFQIKYLTQLRYFLGIEIARLKKGIFLSQRKYMLNMLLEVSMLGCRPVDSPMHINLELLPDQGELLDNPKRYRRLVGKLNYLTT